VLWKDVGIEIGVESIDGSVGSILCVSSILWRFPAYTLICLGWKLVYDLMI